jgi:hypothetical protein
VVVWECKDTSRIVLCKIFRRKMYAPIMQSAAKHLARFVSDAGFYYATQDASQHSV